MRNTEDLHDSKTGPVTIGVFVALGGVFLGFLYLFSFPAQSFRTIAEREEQMSSREDSLGPLPTDAYYLEASVAGGGSWRNKRDQALAGAGGTHVFSAEELNGWFASLVKAESEDEEEEPWAKFNPGSPNVAFGADSSTHVSVPVEYEIGPMSGDFVISMMGEFPYDDRALFRVTKVQVNAAPIPFPMLLGKQILKIALKRIKSGEEYATINEAWGKVASVDVAQGQIELRLR